MCDSRRYQLLQDVDKVVFGAFKERYRKLFNAEMDSIKNFKAAPIIASAGTGYIEIPENALQSIRSRLMGCLYVDMLTPPSGKINIPCECSGGDNIPRLTRLGLVKLSALYCEAANFQHYLDRNPNSLTCAMEKVYSGIVEEAKTVGAAAANTIITPNIILPVDSLDDIVRLLGEVDRKTPDPKKR